jgi:hypothetical protein
VDAHNKVLAVAAVAVAGQENHFLPAVVVALHFHAALIMVLTAVLGPVHLPVVAVLVVVVLVLSLDLMAVMAVLGVLQVAQESQLLVKFTPAVPAVQVEKQLAVLEHILLGQEQGQDLGALVNVNLSYLQSCTRKNRLCL